MDYIVKIEKNSILCPVGTLSERGFQYSEEYLNSPDAKPVSISLPLQKERYSADISKRFFEGLIPEGFSRQSVAAWLHVSEDDYLSILAGLGRECLGAIMISDGTESESAGYRELTMDEVKALAAEGSTRSAKLVTESHLSLTGASGKVGLYYDRNNNKWYQPYGTAPSTHIVKQSHIRLEGIVINELLCQMTAQKCGLSVPECFVLNIGGGRDEDILFVSERYDRNMLGTKEPIDGLSVPNRLHQEDFAQAMGVASLDKYEPEGGTYLVEMFETLRQWSSDPLSDQLKLWDRIVYNCLIGNTDNHLKNVSLLYNNDLTGMRLAPAYDMISTTAYDSGTRHLAMHIGTAGNIDDVNEKAFGQAAVEVHMNEKTVLKRLGIMADCFEKALKEASDTLVEAGYAQAAELRERILLTGGYRNLI